MLNLNYDREYDILRIDIGDPRNAVGCEEWEGLVAMRDYMSNVLTSIMVFDFMERFRAGQLPDVPTDFPYSLKDDVAPLLHAN